MMKRGHDVKSAPSISETEQPWNIIPELTCSLELSSVCVVDAQGKIVKEAKGASEREAWLLSFGVKRIELSIGSQEMRTLLSCASISGVW